MEREWTELTNPDGGSTVPVVHRPSLFSHDQLEYGETVPGVTCPECGSELVHTSNGAFCDWCSSYVPVVGTAVVLEDEEDDDSDWTDDESVS